MAKKIWAICDGTDWYDASVDHLILPDGMDIKQECENRIKLLQKYHLDQKLGKKAVWPGSFTEFLINKGAVVPDENVLEEFWSD